MAYAPNNYTGNGSTVLFPFSFPYIDRAHVKVKVNGVLTTAFTFDNATTIRLNTAPGAGVPIEIFRETPSDTAEAIIFAGSSIRASDLNANTTQLLYVAEETGVGTDQANNTANAAAGAAANAVSSAAAATSTANSALSTANGAVNTANAASNTANNALSTANAASSAASGAVSTANAANATATNALGVANQAADDADDALQAATSAVSTANSAASDASTALSTANNALSTANTASSNATAAVGTANTANNTASTALSNANAAVNTANSASSAATAATNTANAASSTANTALNTANNAASAAAGAVSTANAASAAATAATNTANAASSTANNALNVANQAQLDATAAVIDADNALDEAGVARATADAAIAAVASAVAYRPVVDLTALGALTPADGDFYELTDSTGAESDPSITGVPMGLTGSSVLTFRLRYDDPPGEFAFLGYFANDPENQYAVKATEGVAASAQADADQALLDAAAAQADADQALLDAAAAQSTANAALPKAGGTMTGAITFAGGQTFPGVLPLGGGTLTGNVTFAGGQTFPGVLPLGGGTMTGNITFNGSQTFPVGGIQDASIAQKGVVQLTDSVSSTSTTTAATPNAVKTANDLASSASTTAITALNTANGALQRSGGTMTGNITFNGSQTFPVGGIQSATTGQVGVVQLNNFTNDTSVTQAATANAVRLVNENANLRALKSGDTFTGPVSFPSGTVSAPAIRFSLATSTGFWLDTNGDVNISRSGRKVSMFSETTHYIYGRGTSAVMTVYDRTDTSGGGTSKIWDVTIGGSGGYLLRDGTTPVASLFPLTLSGSEGQFNTYNRRSATTVACFGARATMKYNGAANSLVYAKRITGVTKNGTGDYTVTFQDARGGTEYTIVGMSRVNATNREFIGHTVNTDQTVSSIRINNSNNIGGIVDSNQVHIAIFDD